MIYTNEAGVWIPNEKILHMEMHLNIGQLKSFILAAWKFAGVKLNLLSPTS